VRFAVNDWTVTFWR